MSAPRKTAIGELIVNAAKMSLTEFSNKHRLRYHTLSGLIGGRITVTEKLPGRDTEAAKCIRAVRSLGLDLWPVWIDQKEEAAA